MSAILTEHYDYLSLKGRGETYARAIAAVVRPGDVVADLGCGFGVLGIACLKAGAARVYGIDKSDAIEIARETVQRAGFADRYICIRGSTFTAQLPEQVDVIICDHIGWFGFDYGMIAMLRDASARLLKPGGRIIPGNLQLIIAATSSPVARAKAEAWRHAPIPAEYHWLGEYGLNTKHAHNFAADELASEPVVLGAIDLSAAEPDDFRFTTTLTATTAHTMQGLAGWFACELAPDVWLTNSPVAKGAIARNQVYLPCRHPIVLAAGDEVQVSLRLRHDTEMFAWTIRGPDGRRQKMSTWKSTVLSAADLGKQGS